MFMWKPGVSCTQWRAAYLSLWLQQRDVIDVREVIEQTAKYFEA
jgi:hypothetical protein